MLSRLHRKAETLDQACLRATGHPNDYAIRQELLSALEWDASLHPEHARPVIRNLFQEVYDHSTALLNRLRSADQSDGGLAPAIAEIHTLRERLAKLGQVLTAWKSESRAD